MYTHIYVNTVNKYNLHIYTSNPGIEIASVPGNSTNLDAKIKSVVSLMSASQGCSHIGEPYKTGSIYMHK
jgi:hypothetical protein